MIAKRPVEVDPNKLYRLRIMAVAEGPDGETFDVSHMVTKPKLVEDLSDLVVELLFAHASQALRMQFSEHVFTPHSVADWRPFMEITQEEYRQGQIIMAYLKYKVMEDKPRLDEQEMRTKTGKLVETLNEQNPGLDVTTGEIMEIIRPFAQAALDAMFEPSKRQLASDNPGWKRHNTRRIE
jgi:hypothetical protein